MKEIPKKNYYILVVLLTVTAVLTLTLSNLYLNREKLVSNFYEYANKITPKEFAEYVSENSDLIIYISDKYDLTNETFEKSFEKKLNDKNLKEKLIYLDKNKIDKKFLSKLKDTYNINITLSDTPIIIIIVDGKIIKNISITNNSNVDTIIDYEEFE